jgi:hypothetical protein
MTLVVISSDENVIALPAWSMNSLNLREGNNIKTMIEGQALRLAPLDDFLALRGVLRDDREFDAAMEYLDPPIQCGRVLAPRRWAISRSSPTICASVDSTSGSSFRHSQLVSSQKSDRTVEW